jgi:hypothetical protein
VLAVLSYCSWFPLSVGVPPEVTSSTTTLVKVAAAGARYVTGWSGVKVFDTPTTPWPVPFTVTWLALVTVVDGAGSSGSRSLIVRPSTTVTR